MLHSLLWCFFQWYDASILAFKLLSLLLSFYPCFYVSFPAQRLQCLLWYFNLGFEASISLIMPIYLLSSFYPCFDPFTHVALLLSELPYFYPCCNASIPAVMTLPLLWYCYHFGHVSIHAVLLLFLLSWLYLYSDALSLWSCFYSCSQATVRCWNSENMSMLQTYFMFMTYPWFYPWVYLNIGPSLKPWYLKWFAFLKSVWWLT